MIAFPSSPIVGQQYEYLGRLWQWTGDGWRRVINQGQIVSVFVPVGPLVTVTVEPLPKPLLPPGFVQVNYV